MAVYRFKVVFEDYDEVLREVDLLSKHTFLDLHNIIQQSTGYIPEVASSFYISNDQWIKGDEIAYLPNNRKKELGVVIMENAKLNKYIEDPHQKFYYTYNFDRPYDFHVQLIKILKEESEKQYPSVFKSTGIAPKPFGAIAVDEAAKKEENDEFDFLNEMEYGENADEDMDLVDDEQENDSSEENEENDEFSDEFGDNENDEEGY